MEKLLTVHEAAEKLNCHPQSIYRNDEIPKVKLPGIGVRVKKSFLEKYIDQHSSGPPLSDKQSFDYFALTIPSGNGMKIPNSLGGYSEMPKGKSKTRYNLGYGAVYQRKTKNGRIRWYVDYRDRNGKRIQKVAKFAFNKNQAVEFLKREVLNAHFGDEESSKTKVTFKELAEEFLNDYSKPRKRSWKSDDRYLHTQLVPFFGSMNLGEIKPLNIKDYISKRLHEDKVKPNSINRHLQLLRKMFNYAIDMGYEVGKNPVKSSFLFDESEFRRDRVLSREEEKRLLENSSPHLRMIIEFALGTGCRLKEILGLKVKDLDFKNGTISIRSENNKTKKMDVIPMNSSVKELLVKLIEENNGRSDYVFNFLDSRSGKYGPIKSVKVAFNNACKRAGIDNLQFRDTRRTFSSRLHEKGVDPLIVQRLLRHSSFKTSEQVYIHSNMKMMKAALESLNTQKDTSCDTSVTSVRTPQNSVYLQ